MRWNDGESINLFFDDSDYFKKDNEEAVSIINETLNKIGITVEITDYGSLKFKKDANQHMKMTRGAGKQRKYFDVHKLADIEEEIKKTSAQAVADRLGISRATLFRRIKEAREWNQEEIF